MTVNPSELTVMLMARILAIINMTLKVVYENRYLTARTFIRVSVFGRRSYSKAQLHQGGTRQHQSLKNLERSEITEKQYGLSD